MLTHCYIFRQGRIKTFIKLLPSAYRKYHLYCRNISSVPTSDTVQWVNRMQWPRARRVSATLLRSSRRSQQMLWRRSSCWRMDLFTLLAGGWPLAASSNDEQTTAWSICSDRSRVHSEGCWWPTRCWKAWFHPSQTLFVRSDPATVAACTFQVAGGNTGGTTLRWSRSESDGCGKERRLPLTYVEVKYSTSWSIPSTSGVWSVRYATPSAMSARGRKARPSNIPQKWRTASFDLYVDASPSSCTWQR